MSQEDKFTTFRGIIARLRAPGGCPWDRKQTHSSLKPHLIEESYEVLDAIDSGDSQKLCEELGDLLFQIMLHSQIASEANEFDIEDVLRGISDKLIRRHPHVFGDTDVKDAHEVMVNWEQLKRREREDGESMLDGIPSQMPSLSASQSIQRKVSRVGFDWDDVEGVLEKVGEETKEILDAPDHEGKVEEFGDLLFALVNFARWMDINAEDALRQANKKFILRFKYMESLCRERGLSLNSLSLDGMEDLWNESKRGTGDR
ncbi:MAG: nucleoside triphosphate pyrophosphohydrolase [Dehalococcoidia bacterium]|nr:nucleoside triphosphate pyrophosphohydrolase [Dehalococcoidia bacterium]